MLKTLRCPLLLFIASASFIANSFAQVADSWKEYDEGKLFYKVDDFANVRIGEYDGTSASLAKLNEQFHHLISAYDITSVKQAFKLPDLKLQNIYLIEFGKTELTENLIEELSQVGFTDYAERVPLYRSFYTPDDLHPNQWHLQKINAEGAWDLSRGDANIVVAVVDDAVRTDHEDLAANIWVNPGEIAGNGVDDDGNGYIDDVNGFDVADNDNNPDPPSVNPGNHSHGTHCAGIISAASDNSTGIASIGFQIKLMAVKTRGASTPSPYLTNPYSGVSYAIAAGADVISMSWGGGSYSLTYQNLFNHANSLGIVLVAAAGNSNTNIPHYPANYNHVISVAASNPSDQKASFSNYGTWVDVSSPGTSIWSTLSSTTSSYGSMSGTSMACPLVSGLCGLLLSYAPYLTPADLESCLKGACDDIDALNPSYTGQLGAGRINAHKALLCLQTAPWADFTADYTEVCAGQLVQFTDESFGQAISSWSWFFSGGTPSISSLQNPSVSYTSPGLYSVTLIVTNSYGTSDTTKIDFIHVTPPTATLSGSTTIVQGTATALAIDFTGTPPWSVTYTDGITPVTLSGITTTPHFISVAPFDTTDYTLVSFFNAFCSGTVSGNALINVVPPPQSLSCNYANVYGDANFNLLHEKFYDAVNNALYILGTTTVSGVPQVIVMKVDRLGNMIFAKSYNIAGSGSRLNAVRAPNDDLLIIGMHTADSHFILRIDSNGNIVWVKNFGSAGRERYPVIVNSVGDSYLISCWHTSGGTSDDIGLYKIDGSGNVLWAKTLHTADDQLLRMFSNGSGGCVLACEIVTTSRVTGLAEIDGNGNIVWSKQISGSTLVFPGGIIKTLDGGYAMSGKTGTNYANGYFMKLDAALNVQWTKGFSGLASNINMPSQLIQDKYGSYYVPVCTTLAGISYQAAVMKYDVNGNFTWSKTLDYVSDVNGSRFEIMNTNSVPDDNLIIAGASENYAGGFGNSDYLLFSTDTSLNTCITQTVAAPASVSLPITLSNWIPTVGTNTITTTNLNLTASNAPFSMQVICTNCNNSCDAFASINPSSYAVCEGGTITFTSDSIAPFYDWKRNGISFSNARDTSYHFTAAGTYTISLLTVDSICTDIDSIIITVNGLPFVTAQPDTVLCLSNSVQLSATGGTTYSWAPSTGLSNSTMSNPVATPFSSTNYKVFATDANGCSNSDSIFVEVETCCGSSAAFTVSDTFLCFGDTLTFQNQSVTRGTPLFNWFFGSDAIPLASSQANPPPVKYAGGGIYEVSLVLTDSCGTNVAKQNVYVYNQPAASAGRDTSLCIDDTLLYQMGEPPVSFYAYTWLPATGLSDLNSSEPVATLTGSATYYMEVTDIISGCKAYDTITIGAFYFGASYITGLDSVYCTNENGGTIQGYPPGGTFSGSGIINNSFFNPKTVPPGLNEIIYAHPCADTARAWVKIVDADSCDNTNSIQDLDNDGIKVYPNPFLNSITIDLSHYSGEGVEIRLKDVLGREILRTAILNQAENQIGLPDELSGGIYFLEVKTKERIRIFKLLKAIP